MRKLLVAFAVLVLLLGGAGALLWQRLDALAALPPEAAELERALALPGLP